MGRLRWGWYAPDQPPGVGGCTCPCHQFRPSTCQEAEDSLATRGRGALGRSCHLRRPLRVVGRLGVYDRCRSPSISTTSSIETCVARLRTKQVKETLACKKACW